MPGAEVNEIVFSGVTVIVPVLVTVPHPPVNVMVYVYGLPMVELGVPLILMALEAQFPDTPGGSPEMIAPVAPVVE